MKRIMKNREELMNELTRREKEQKWVRKEERRSRGGKK